jgi:CMP/dCMP kinase
MGFAINRRGASGLAAADDSYLKGFPWGVGVLNETSRPHRETVLPVGPVLLGLLRSSPMKVMTISREYGAGGGEVARRLADALGWELLDRALLHQAAAAEHVPDADLERLDEQAVSLVDRFRLHPPHKQYMHGITEAARQAAARGNVILVGRGTRHLLGDLPGVFHLRLVAPREWRAQRMSGLEDCSLEQALARCVEVDRTRDRFTQYFFGAEASAPEQYDLVVNTGRVSLEDVVTLLAALARGEPSTETGGPTATRRVLTLSRQLGAADRGFAPTLGDRLGLNVYDRELLEQEAIRLGVAVKELEQVDERSSGIFRRLRPGSLDQRYFDALQQRMKELAERGNVLLVGRGGSGFLRDRPEAFHIRLVAALSVRVRRVMEHRWVREELARQLIAQSDAERRGFYEGYFGADWSSPLEYHLTVNSGRLGPAAVDLLGITARQHWTGPRG